MKEKLFLLFIIFFGITIRLVNLDQPPIEWFPTRQVMDADIIRSFYRGETTFFRPVVHNFIRPGYLLQEFPLLWWFIGKTMWMFGGFSIAGARFSIVLFYPLLCLALYQLQKQFFSEISMRLLPVAVITILPLSIIQSRSIQPEFPIITILMWILVFWIKYLKKRETKFFLATGLFLTLSVLMKPFDLYILAPMCITVLLLPQKDRLKSWIRLTTLSFLAAVVGYLWWFEFVPQVRATTPSIFDVVWQSDFVSTMLKIHLPEIRFWKGLMDNFVVATVTNIGTIFIFGFGIISVKDLNAKRKAINVYVLSIIVYGLAAVSVLIMFSINSLQEYYFSHLLIPVSLAITYFLKVLAEKLFPESTVKRLGIIFCGLLLIFLSGRKFVDSKLNITVDQSSLMVDQVKLFVPIDETVAIASQINPTVHGFYLDRWNTPFTLVNDAPRSILDEKVINYEETHGNKRLSPIDQLNELSLHRVDYLLITDLENFENDKIFKDFIFKEKEMIISDRNGYLFRL